jgi:hypothetical protein
MGQKKDPTEIGADFGIKIRKAPAMEPDDG